MAQQGSAMATWVWVIILVVIGAILYFWFFSGDPDVASDAGVENTAGAVDNQGSVGSGAGLSDEATGTVMAEDSQAAAGTFAAAENQLESGNATSLVGISFSDQQLVVTEVESDRLVRAATARDGEGVLLYLSDEQQEGKAPTLDLSAGDTITVSGEFVNNLSDQAVTAADQSVIANEPVIFLANELVETGARSGTQPAATSS